MELGQIKTELNQIAMQIEKFRGLFDLDAKNKRIHELELEMTEPSFWDDQKNAQTVIDENNNLKHTVNRFEEINSKYEDLEATYELVKEEEDQELLDELNRELSDYQEEISEYELEMLLNEPYDANNAIVELHPGAGGTESQDWASILLRMYQRWCEHKNYKVETLDYLPGDEAGVKSVTLLVKGYNAYGYLKSEKGVHRLVRISPFDSSGRRHTSFVSCDVTPEMSDDVDIEVKNEDIKIDTYRASGAGGQHVNTTDSAVRITHIPTHVVVTCQNERSQIKNREAAMKMLKSKLYQLEIEKQQEELAAIRGEQKEIGWGSQIRSYVFHPYTMVKDHRTNVEAGNAQGVVDGELDPFIDAYLRSTMQS
ncbi:peptide chain release factor 2 [Virgibacillus sp. MSJ-26]|nr:peptide chain release factor 2 [Virgibacillus sp. MSJ-26]